MAEHQERDTLVPGPNEPGAHESSGSIKAVVQSIDSLREVLDQNDRTVKTAINELRTTVLEHYERITKRVDEHAKRIRVLEAHCGIMRPHTGDGL